MKKIIALAFTLLFGINFTYADTSEEMESLIIDDVVCTVDGNKIHFGSFSYEREYDLEVRHIVKDNYDIYINNRGGVTTNPFGLRRGIKIMARSIANYYELDNTDRDSFIDFIYDKITNYFGLKKDSKEVSYLKDQLCEATWLYLPEDKDISYLIQVSQVVFIDS